MLSSGVDDSSQAPEGKTIGLLLHTWTENAEDGCLGERRSLVGMKHYVLGAQVRIQSSMIV